MQEFISYSEEDTINFADKFAENLNKNSVIILSGHFGLEDEISSPTFTIVNEYHSDNMNIYHFDLYRLSDIDEFYAMGGEEYLGNGICIFEWGEMIEDMLGHGFTKITFDRDLENVNYRKLIIEEF